MAAKKAQPTADALGVNTQIKIAQYNAQQAKQRLKVAIKTRGFRERFLVNAAISELELAIEHRVRIETCALDKLLEQ